MIKTTNPEVIENVQDGSMQFYSGSSGSLVDYAAGYALFDVPNAFHTLEAMREVLVGYTESLNDFYAESSGFTTLTLMDAGFRNTMSNREIRSPEDFGGMKIRVQENQYYAAYWEALGASPIAMDYNELYTNLQQGVVEASDLAYTFISARKFYEVEKYLVLTQHLGHVAVTIVNTEMYNSLPENVRTLFDECWHEAEAYAAEINDQLLEENIAEVHSKMEVIELDAATKAFLYEKADAVVQLARQNLGDELVDSFVAACDAANAKFD